MQTVEIRWTMTMNEHNFSKKLGKRIASFRKEQGLTQQQLADLLNIKQYTVARFEIGLCRVPVALLPQFGRILGVSVDDLLGIPSAKSKPGPAPKLRKQLEKIQALPKEKQNFVLQAVEMALKT